MSTLGQIGQMARRSILQTLRQPAMVIPPIVFPLLLVSINSAGLDAATKIPGFPADSYWDFAIAVPFIQGSLFAAINAGTALARDVETGFIKRLAMTPMQRTALLVGQLIGVDGRRVRLRLRLPGRPASPPAWTSRRARSACPAIIAARRADRARLRGRSAPTSGCARARARRSRASSRCCSCCCS